MAKDDNFEIEGEVVDKIPGGKFRVKIIMTDGKEHFVNASLSGKIRINNIKIVVGDKVKVALSPYDINNGYINRRL